MAKFKVIRDDEHIYTEGQIITDSQIIADYLNAAAQTEDADLIGWIQTLHPTDAAYEISDIWDIVIEEI